MNNRDRQTEWERGWKGHERAQRRRLAQLPFSEKLQWLEEAHDLVRRLKVRVIAPPQPSGDAVHDPELKQRIPGK